MRRGRASCDLRQAVRELGGFTAQKFAACRRFVKQVGDLDARADRSGSRFYSSVSGMSSAAHVHKTRCSTPATREVIATSATEAIDANASPRKPSDSTPSNSSRLAILLVACRASASGNSPRECRCRCRRQ